jgi:hypothetical protein
MAPAVGSAVCQFSRPVKTLSADQAPQVIFCPLGTGAL